MVYAVLAVAVGLFAIGLRLTGVIPRARGVLTGVSRALEIIRATDLTDDEKEAIIRTASLDMFAVFFSILTRTAAAVVIPFALLALCIGAQFFEARQAVSASMDWRFIGASALLVTALLAVRR